MKLLRYSDLDASKLETQFERTASLLEAGNFRGAEVKKLSPGPYYRAKLSAADRLLFRFGSYRGETHLILLEVIRNHDYESSRFLRGATIDESKLLPVSTPAPVETNDVLVLPYVNSRVSRVHILDKILSFDELQESALTHRPPLILIGSAGSGKTVLTLEKLRQLPGEILYVTHSSFLVDNARNLYYANHYENDAQDVDFLSFQEFVQSIAVPPGCPLAYSDFAAWFTQNSPPSLRKEAHPVFEEFNGVLTGSAVTHPYLTQTEYFSLGIRRSIFTGDQRPAVYALFLKYLDFLRTAPVYDLNLVCFQHHERCKPRYDFVVADEVQDLTSVQLSLILKSLRYPDQFILCGDANQIVHPNFFSWAGVKSYFYEQKLQGSREIIRILNTNYRNSPQVTELANRLLLIKNARFGSIDRESHYLVRPISENPGEAEFLEDSPAVRRDIDVKTGRSTRFAVLVLREEDKHEARRDFRTPLVFSVREAKGLEYENIILLNFVSGNARVFNELADGITPEDLKSDFTYARARDKSDKSLEGYKFFINALYVAITRAVRNLYILEKTPAHPLLSLLQLRLSRNTASLAAQQSSVEEWKEEARKLELQGKTEQVESIRHSILRTEPVPWLVITPDTLERLRRDAMNTEAVNMKARRLLLDYAATYSAMPLLRDLAAVGFKPAQDPNAARAEAQLKYGGEFRQRGHRELNRKIERHGVDFRNPLNQTPLMIAVQLGLAPLVRQLVNDGANIGLRDNWGRTPLQLALRAAYQQPYYATHVLGSIYSGIAPPAIKVRIGGCLVKIDSHRMEFFLLNSMLALFEFILRAKIHVRTPAFETADFVYALEHFPESVIPLRRRTRQAITSVLAANEVYRADRNSRMLFVRLQRGFYVPNPAMDIEVADRWVNVCEILGFSHLEQEQGDWRLERFLEVIRKVRADLAARTEPETKAKDAVQPPASDTDQPAKRSPGEPQQSSTTATQGPKSHPDEFPLDDILQQPPLAVEDVIPSDSLFENPKVSRNAPCPCGSGKKFKKCCARGMAS